MKISSLLLFAAVTAVACPGAGYRLYVGTYTPAGGASRGIYTLTFDPATGRFGESGLAAAAPNPSFLALRPDGGVLYAAEEDGGNGRVGGAVMALACDAATGRLRLLNRRAATGADTAHLAVDATGHLLVTANYTGSQIAAFPLQTNGRLSERST